MSIKNAEQPIERNFASLVAPIFIDNFLRMIALVFSYGLISRISDVMAGILGVTNLYLIVGFCFCEYLAQGSSIILTQYLGARKETNQVCALMIWLNILIGLILSCVFVLFSSFLLSMFGFPGDILQEGAQYLRIVGSGFGVYAFNYALLYILNAYRLTKYTMSYSFLVNGASIFFYYLIAILPLNFAISRITLIALTNLFVRCLGMVFLLVIINLSLPHVHLHKKMRWEKIKHLLPQFLRIGFPNITEPLSSQLFQFVLVKIISMISIESMSIRSYLISLTSLFEVGAHSISRGNQIVLGYLIGAKKSESIIKQLKKGVLISFIISSIILYFGITFRYDIMRFFSKDVLLVNMGAELLILVAILTLIRSFTFNLHGGLKAAGDLKFGFGLTICGMWMITIPGSYILIRFFNVGLQGVWIMLVFDELLRVFLLLQRWKSQKWKKFSVVKESIS